MLPDRVSNPGPLTYESGALPIALRGPATVMVNEPSVFEPLTFYCSCPTESVPKQLDTTLGPEVIKLFSYSTQLGMKF